jgi:hypothetical protein
MFFEMHPSVEAVELRRTMTKEIMEIDIAFHAPFLISRITH